MGHDRRHPLPTLCLALALAAGPLGAPALAQLAGAQLAGAQLAGAEVAGPPRIIDGDSLEVQGRLIHLYGIDAPELGQACRIGKRAYDCGKIARTALLDLTAGVTVRCKLAPVSPEDDPEASPEDGATDARAVCLVAPHSFRPDIWSGWSSPRLSSEARYTARRNRFMLPNG